MDPRDVLAVAEPRWERFDAFLVKEALEEMRALPGRLAELLRGAGTPELEARYREGGWTVAQVVHHLVDSHLHSYVRCKFALLENGPAIKPYDENRWVETSECGPEQVEEAVAFLEHLHRRWARMLEALTPAQWERTFFHPERDEYIVLFRQVGVYAWHGEHHLAHIAQALGRPIPNFYA
jgi:hypothetical protein